jgi:hypothetical protein
MGSLQETERPAGEVSSSGIGADDRELLAAQALIEEARRRQRRRRRWVSGTVVVLAAGSLLTLKATTNGGPPRRLPPRPTPSPRSPGAALAAPAITPLAAQYLPVGWMGNITSSGSSLYGALQGNGNPGPGVVRIDSSTGAIIAQAPLGIAEDNAEGPLFLVGSSLWTSDAPLNPGIQGGHHPELVQLNATTLAVEQRIELPASDEGANLAPAPTGLWVGTTDRLLLLDPVTGATEFERPLPAGEIGSWVSVDPTGKLLYVAEEKITAPNSKSERRSILITESSATTGAVLATREISGALSGISAAQGGVWIESETAPTNNAVLTRLSAAHLDPTASVVRTGGVAGQNGTVFSISGGLLWVIDPAGLVSCASPQSGHLLATQSFPLPWGIGTTPLVSTGVKAYLATSKGVAVFTPDPACAAG